MYGRSDLCAYQMTTAMTVASLLCGLGVLGIWIWIAVALHIAYTKMELVLELLKNSSAIKERAFLNNSGPWGKLLLIGGVSGIVTFPGFFLKQGSINTEDLSNLPQSMKKKLVALHWSAITLLFYTAFFCGFGGNNRKIRNIGAYLRSSQKYTGTLACGISRNLFSRQMRVWRIEVEAIGEVIYESL